jgi:hypothetical protein
MREGWPVALRTLTRLRKRKLRVECLHKHIDCQKDSGITSVAREQSSNLFNLKKIMEAIASEDQHYTIKFECSGTGGECAPVDFPRRVSI